jgi:hypothetical protein
MKNARAHQRMPRLISFDFRRCGEINATANLTFKFPRGYARLNRLLVLLKFLRRSTIMLYCETAYRDNY